DQRRSDGGRYGECDDDGRESHERSRGSEPAICRAGIDAGTPSFRTPQVSYGHTAHVTVARPNSSPKNSSVSLLPLCRNASTSRAYGLTPAEAYSARAALARSTADRTIRSTLGQVRASATTRSSRARPTP